MPWYSRSSPFSGFRGRTMYSPPRLATSMTVSPDTRLIPPRSAMGPKFQGCAGFGVQFPAVLLQALTRLQDNADDVGLRAPGARGAFQRGGVAAKPVEVGHGEEAVRVGAVALVRRVPLLPVGVEGFEGCFSGQGRSHSCWRWRTGWIA